MICAKDFTNEWHVGAGFERMFLVKHVCMSRRIFFSDVFTIVLFPVETENEHAHAFHYLVLPGCIDLQHRSSLLHKVVRWRSVFMKRYTKGVLKMIQNIFAIYGVCYMLSILIASSQKN